MEKQEGSVKKAPSNANSKALLPSPNSRGEFVFLGYFFAILQYVTPFIVGRQIESFLLFVLIDT